MKVTEPMGNGHYDSFHLSPYEILCSFPYISVNAHSILLGQLLQDGHEVWKHRGFYYLLFSLGNSLDDIIYIFACFQTMDFLQDF